MASWGGARRGAGRPRGTGNNRRAIAARSRHRAQRLEFEIDAREMAMKALREREAEILDRLLNSEDDRVVFACWRTLRAYASGEPGRHTSVEVNVVSPAAVLAEIAAERRRRAEAAVAVRLLPPEPPAA